MSRTMGLARFAVALIWAFTMLGTMGALTLGGANVSAALMDNGKGNDEDRGNAGGNGNAGGGQGQGGGNGNAGGNGGGNGGGQGQGGGAVEGDVVGDQGGGAPAENFVTICHATGSSSNPYVEITVNANAYDGGGHNTHEGDLPTGPEGGCPAGTPADDETDGDETDGDETDGDETDGDAGEPNVIVDIDENGQGTITFDLDGDGTVDFEIVFGEGRSTEE